MSAWGDLLSRMTQELSTDTMEIANLDNQRRGGRCGFERGGVGKEARVRVSGRGESIVLPGVAWREKRSSNVRRKSGRQKKRHTRRARRDEHASQ
eukprot:1420246-Rhodomonas_salina.1